MWSAIQSNVPGDSIDKDTYYRSTRQKGTMKYLRESYYHHIEYSVTNSLTALIWKWYLNSNFQPYSYFQRLQESANRTGINVRNLVYPWRVEMKEGRQYKRKRIHWGVRLRKRKENSITTGTRLVIKFKRDIYNNTSPRIGPKMIFFG